MEKYGKKIIWALLCIYIASVFYLSVLCRVPTAEIQYNLELFWEFKTLLAGNKHYAEQIYRNIVLYIPMGFLAYYASRSYKLSFLIGLITSLAIEFSQLVFRLGLFEFDDIFNNALGTIIGIAISAIMSKIIKIEKAYTILAIVSGMVAVGVSIYANIKF